MFLTRISVFQPVFATMVMLAITIFGAVSYSRLPIESLPNVDVPVVAVVVSYPDASPEAVEEDVVEPIEEELATLAGIDEIRSTSRSGQAMVILSFDLGVSGDSAAQEVRDRLGQVERILPDGAEQPTVLRFDPNSEPVMSLAISGRGESLGSLTGIAEDVVSPRLLNVSGVGSASVVGSASRQLDILLDPDRMNAYGISVSQITAAVAEANQDVPAGDLESATNVQSVTVEGRIPDASGFLDITVGSLGGQPVSLGDVATVTRTEAEATSVALLDGERALAIDVVKQQGANTVAVAEGVRAAVEDLAANELPDGIFVDIIRDNAVEVEESFHSVQNMLIEGAILATLIVFLFLNSWRSTIITGLTLPISVIGTMTALYALGFTLNVMTLLALSLAVGLLIDDAIVVRENIMRHLHMGKSHLRAALEGTQEIGLAVLATTFAIVAVFLPVAFMEGIIGRFFLSFGVTVSVAVLISLFVAFTLDPMLSSVWYDPDADPQAPKGPLWRLIARFDRGFEALGRAYGRVVRWVLRHRYWTLAGTAAAFLSSFALLPFIGVEFQPRVDTGEFRVRLETPQGSSLDYTTAKVRQAEGIIRAFPEVEQTYSTIAGGMNGSNTSARINVTLVAEEDRDVTSDDMTRRVREALEVIPGLAPSVGSANGFGQFSSPVELTISGDSFEVLRRLGDDLSERLAAIEGVTDIESSLDETQPTIAVRLNPDAADDFDVSLPDVGNALATLVGGQTVGEWTSQEGLTYDLNVQLPEEVRGDVETLGALPIATGDGAGLIRLDQVARFEPSTGAISIERQDAARTVEITANLSGRTLGEVQAELDAATAALDMPAGYRILQGGEAEELAEAGGSAITALVLAVTFIYLVLASQFGSFLQPLAIMMSLPLSLMGVLAGLIVGGSTLNMYSAIGFIMLMGLVVKNAILLVDNANQRVSEGENLYDALVEAGQTRFRPIIMTTLAMIFGMLPLALNLHGGSGQNAPMAHAVIGGLISSTLLTLVVVPVVLTFLDTFGRRVARLFPAPPDHAGQEPAAEPAPALRRAAE